jgi:thioredoxin-like negative regulator of GroEL
VTGDRAQIPGSPVTEIKDLIAAGTQALRSGDAAGARRAFESALAESAEDGDVIEGLARAAYLDLDFLSAMESWERAYAAHRAAANQIGAVRVARTLAYMHGSVMGDWAVMSGWIARAQTLLAGAADSGEAGWVALNLGMFESDRARKDEHFRTALAVARRVGDAALEFVTLAYLGASLVHADRTEEGMVLLDEALAAVAGREVDDFLVLEEIFCQLFSACEHAHDVGRADQWSRVGEEIARRRNLPAVSAFCRTHYGGVLTAAGRWPEADEALMEAVRLWGLGHRSLRTGALVRLADLRVRQGRFEEAEQLLDGLQDDANAARPLAAIALARSQTSLARHVLERALDPLDPTSAAAAPLLALLGDGKRRPVCGPHGSAGRFLSSTHADGAGPLPTRARQRARRRPTRGGNRGSSSRAGGFRAARRSPSRRRGCRSSALTRRQNGQRQVQR